MCLSALMINVANSTLVQNIGVCTDLNFMLTTIPTILYEANSMNLEHLRTTDESDSTAEILHCFQLRSYFRSDFIAATKSRI